MVAVADAGVAPLPLDGVEGVRAGIGEEALDREGGSGLDVLDGGGLRVGSHLRSRSFSLLRAGAARTPTRLCLLGPSIVPLGPDGKTSGTNSILGVCGIAQKGFFGEFADSVRGGSNGRFSPSPRIRPTRLTAASWPRPSEWRSETIQRGSQAAQRAAPQSRQRTISSAASTTATIAPVDRCEARRRRLRDVDAGEAGRAGRPGGAGWAGRCRWRPPARSRRGPWCQRRVCPRGSVAPVAMPVGRRWRRSRGSWRLWCRGRARWRGPGT